MFKLLFQHAFHLVIPDWIRNLLSTQMQNTPDTNFTDWY